MVVGNIGGEPQTRGDYKRTTLYRRKNKYYTYNYNYSIINVEYVVITTSLTYLLSIFYRYSQLWATNT